MTHTNISTFITSMWEQINNSNEVFFMVKGQLMQAVAVANRTLTYKNVETGKTCKLDTIKKAYMEITSLC